MPEARLDIQRTTTTRGTLKVKLDHYIDNLATIMAEHNVPEGAKVQIEIPGGGDYSGMRLDANEVDIVVTWEIVEHD